MDKKSAGVMTVTTGPELKVKPWSAGYGDPLFENMERTSGCISVEIYIE